MLSASAILQKMDEHGVDKIALIPSMNDPLPKTPEVLLSAVRQLMSHKLSRPLAEVIHRTILTPEGDLRLEGKRFQIYHQPDNQSVADMVQAYPAKFLGWVFLNPRNNPRVMEDFEQWTAIPGMIGIKLHPHWHDYRTELLGPIFEQAQSKRLPVLIHLGFRQRGNFHELCEQFPKVTIISAHAGFPFYRDLWRYKGKYPNLMVDLSSPYLNEHLVHETLKYMGSERCLYGTDSPYGFPESDGSYDYGEIRRWIERSPLRASELETVMGQNFSAILSQS
jgi:uncharacterized protein